jgi:hypothetical protein
LLETQVAAELVAGESGHTLFDFVDDASLASLKLQAQVCDMCWGWMDCRWMDGLQMDGWIDGWMGGNKS